MSADISQDMPRQDSLELGQRLSQRLSLTAATSRRRSSAAVPLAPVGEAAEAEAAAAVAAGDVARTS